MSMSFCLARGVGTCARRVRVYRISRSPDAPSARIVPDTIGAWPDGEQAGHAIPSSETRSWGLLFREQISYLVGLHCFCRGCLVEVVQKRELPFDAEDLR